MGKPTVRASTPQPQAKRRRQRWCDRLDDLGRWKWPLVAANILVILTVLAASLYSFFQRTQLLTPIPADLMPMVWAMRFVGAIMGLVPMMLVLRLGGTSELIWRNGMMAFLGVPVAIVPMNDAASRFADAALFAGSGVTTSQVECPISDFGGRSDYYAKVDCDGSGDVVVEILGSYFYALKAVRQKRAPGGELNVCMQLTVQTSGLNKRLVLPSVLDVTPPRLSNCTPGQG